MDDFLPCTAAIKALAIARELEPVEALVDIGVGDGFLGSKIKDDNNVLTVPGMENCGVTAFWMHGDIHRKIAQGDLASRRPERPLIGQKHRAIRLGSRAEGTPGRC